MSKKEKRSADIIDVQKDLMALAPKVSDDTTRILFINDKQESAQYKRAKLSRFFVKGWQAFKYTTTKHIDHAEIVKTARANGCNYIEVDILSTKDQAKINELTSKDNIRLIQTVFPPDKPNVFILIG